jgi:hypothetical protein
MTTTNARRDILASIGNTRDTLAQAELVGSVERGLRNDWRADALERAGELALAGRLMESRRMAEQAR